MNDLGLAGKLPGDRSVGRNRHVAFDAAALSPDTSSAGCDERGLPRGRLNADWTAREQRPSPSRGVAAVIVVASPRSRRADQPEPR